MPQASAGRHIRNEGYVSADDGVRLYYRGWRPAAADVSSVVLFIHGIGLHGDAPPYGARVVNPGLLGRGTAFYAADLRGHGQSGGRLEGISGDVLIGDLKCQVSHLQAVHGSVPLYLYGHNFGGLLSLGYAAAHGRDVRGVIVSEYSRLIKNSARQIVGQGATASVLDRIVGRLRPQSRSFRFLAPAEYRQLCSKYHIPVDGDILRSLEKSDCPGSRMEYGKEFFTACGAGDEFRIAGKVRSPVLMMFARNDPFFDIRGAYDVLTRISSLDKMLIQVDVAGHYGIIESSQDHVDRWITSRLPRNA
ncbi:MAG: Alpha/beta hydrolase family protein [Methanocella sp. PtaU1.Bin125]|nr:MAG: Alpha/beta hydrolase family protein [Methanocella sp. PtaU1.Bin125]